MRKSSPQSNHASGLDSRILQNPGIKPQSMPGTSHSYSSVVDIFRQMHHIYRISLPTVGGLLPQDCPDTHLASPVSSCSTIRPRAIHFKRLSLLGAIGVYNGYWQVQFCLDL